MFFTVMFNNLSNIATYFCPYIKLFPYFQLPQMKDIKKFSSAEKENLSLDLLNNFPHIIGLNSYNPG